MDKVYWTMKNGQQIDVDDMTENHLRNTLKLILRRVEKDRRGVKSNIKTAFSEEEIKALENSPYLNDDNYWK